MKYLLLFILSFNILFAAYDDKDTDYSKLITYNDIEGREIFAEAEFFLKFLTSLDFDKLNKGLQKNVQIEIQSNYNIEKIKYIMHYEITRQTNNSPMVIKLWIDVSEELNDYTVFAKVNVFKDATKTNPYGEMTADYGIYKLDFKNLNTFNLAENEALAKVRIQSKILANKNTFSETYIWTDAKNSFYLENKNGTYSAVNKEINYDDNTTYIKKIYIPKSSDLLYTLYYSDYGTPNTFEYVYNIDNKALITSVSNKIFNIDGSNLYLSSSQKDFIDIQCNIPKIDINVSGNIWTYDNSFVLPNYYYSDEVLNFDYNEINNTITCDINGTVQDVIIKKRYIVYKYPIDNNASISDAIFLDANDETLYPSVNIDEIKSIGIPSI